MTNTIAPTSASKRSITPPWPGIRLELSFTPVRRLIQLSAMSPNCPASATSAESTGRAESQIRALLRDRHRLPLGADERARLLGLCGGCQGGCKHVRIHWH